MASSRSGAPDWREVRRQQALVLKRKGWKQNLIAEALGVSPGAVSRWLKTAATQGEHALHARPRPGAPARLTASQKCSLSDLLAHGAEAHGFRGEVWTCRRVAAVIAQEFHVRYHRAHVARLLRDLGWTPQMPLQRAAQRDEAEIERWRCEVWPKLKKRLV